MIHPNTTNWESDDLQLALDALVAAQSRAHASGNPLVVMENGRLVRKGPNEYVVLKELPPRRQVTDRVKFATPRADS